MYVNAKMTPIETTPGMGTGIKESGGEEEFQYNMFDTV
jgi:hypothetical protein